MNKATHYFGAGRFLCLLGLRFCFTGAIAAASEPWWHEYTPIASLHGRVNELETVHAGAVRGAGYHCGWYGFWFLDAQEQGGYAKAGSDKVSRTGAKEIMYYDLGEVGDYAGFFSRDGRMKYTGWSLPYWKGDEPLTARWFGLQAFTQNVPWAPYPTAKAYDLPAFTMPDGEPAGDLYAVLSRRGLDGKWDFDYFSNEEVTDDQAERSGLAEISGRQTGNADTQGKTGWETVRLVHADYANPQLRDYVCREVARIIPKARPDGIHADNLGDNNLGHADSSAFGFWSLHTFRQYMQSQFTSAELEQMGITNIATFDIAAYIQDKPFESRGKPWHTHNPKWAQDPVWLCYLINKVKTAQAYHKAFYETAKKSAHQAGYDCAVFGNTIPFPLGGALMKGACDIAHFEWSTVKSWWGMRPMGLPPKGRAGYVTRLGAAISDAPFCWPSLYVEKNMSGKGHENLHKVLAFDGLANRGLLDFGHGYLDGYSPGTAESAGIINRFIRANAPRISNRRYLADVAVVHSAWSEVASFSIFNPVMDMFVDEYCGWCQFLGDTHRQWDVVLEQDLTAENLARFPVIVLPSVMVLTEQHVNEISRYVQAGGRLVATGQTGTRYGQDRFLTVRATNALSSFTAVPNVQIVANKPGVAYWRQDRDASAAKQMAALLDAAAFRPRIETDAPMTVGVNINIGRDQNGPLITLDLNNCDIEVQTDMINPAPACAMTIRLPDEWRDSDLLAGCVWPEMKEGQQPMPLTGESFAFDRNNGMLRLKAPSFQTYMIIYIQPTKF